MSLAKTIFIMFISLMQSVNRAQLLNITFLIAFFVAVDAAPVFPTVIITLNGKVRNLYHKTCFP